MAPSRGPSEGSGWGSPAGQGGVANNHLTTPPPLRRALECSTLGLPAPVGIGAPTGEGGHVATTDVGELRPYQTAIVSAYHRAVADGIDRMYVSLPTGCGKTRVSSEIIFDAIADDDRVLWIVHTRELVRQAAYALQSRLAGEPWERIPTVGIVMADEDSHDADIVVCSIQTIRSDRLETIGERDLCVVDECHHVAPDNTYAAVIDRLQPKIVLGITATPWRGDKRAMTDVLPTCIYERGISEMIQDGWLCELRYRQIPVASLDLTDVKVGRKLGELDFVERELAPHVERDDVMAETVEKTAPLLGHRPTLVFCASVLHSQLLAKFYAAEGFAAEAVWGDMPAPDRDRILRDWRSGRVQIVTNCAVLTEGFDYPRIGAVVIARPTMSVGLYTQMIGRGTRIAHDKDHCRILDITGRMPARAVPIDFQDIIGETLEKTAQGTLVVAREMKEEAKAPRVHALRDPYGRARWSWTESPWHSGVWFCPVGEQVVALLIPTNGLYQSFVTPVSLRGTGTPVPAGPMPVPRRQAIADLEASLAAAKGFVASFARSNSRWKTEEPSDKQLAILRQKDFHLWKQATDQNWSKGDVSLAITAALIRPAIIWLLRKVAA